MATWVNGEVPAASKFQALDDRVTALETRNSGILTGSGVYTVSASSQLVVTHNLGTIPSQVFFSSTDSGHLTYMFRVTAKTSSTFTVTITVSNTAGTGAAGQTVPADWLVFA